MPPREISLKALWPSRISKKKTMYPSFPFFLYSATWHMDLMVGVVKTIAGVLETILDFEVNRHTVGILG